MLTATKEFITFLNQNNLRYYLGDVTANGNEQITIYITSQILSDISIHFLFDSNNQIVYIRIWNLLKVPAHLQNTALVFVNELNNSYRFARFYLNSDNGIDILVDSFIQAGTVGKNLYESWHRNRKNVRCHPTKAN